MSGQHMVSVHITRGTLPTWAALLTWGLSNFVEFFCNSCSALALKTLQIDSSPFYYYSRTCIKGIPLFCTAHPLLRITLRHSRWRRFLPLARKEQTRAAFAELKLLFATYSNAGDRLTASWFAIEKQENERNVRDAEVCSGFLLRSRRVVELLNCPGWGFGLRVLWSLWDSSTALQLH